MVLKSFGLIRKSFRKSFGNGYLKRQRCWRRRCSAHNRIQNDRKEGRSRKNNLTRLYLARPPPLYILGGGAVQQVPHMKRATAADAAWGRWLSAALKQGSSANRGIFAELNYLFRLFKICYVVK